MEADWYSHFAKESLYVTYIQGNWGGGIFEMQMSHSNL